MPHLILDYLFSQSTTADPMGISNGIFIGDWPVVKFFGDFSFDLKKTKLEVRPNL